ncbi:MBL fold metallo-hydrolase [Polyangium aurulentum]|uniref:MBL fold metallo-hydrolase n=1 Tax=Polyangium aurulentum TaxID=2567896 RepID=UPI0023DF9AAE|nr:MBL fold metallo-hydrolase [Polyangium aurulentum]
MSLRRHLLASELLNDLSQNGVTLWSEDDRLRYRAPEGMLTPATRAMMAELKAELLAILRDRPPPQTSCVVRSFVVNPFRQKCYVCHSEGEAVIVDPGCSSEAERQAVLDYITANRLSVVRVLLTHGHVDHFFGCGFFARHFDKPFEMHADDVWLLKTAEVQANMVGATVEPPPPPGGFLQHGDVVSFGKVRWEVLHCPGHSPGSICFHDAENGLLVTGDVLFRGAVGYITMPGGSLAQLLDSVNDKLLPLPEDTLVYPGHGPLTTIGVEQKTNSWVPQACGPAR